jgi:hypothetical protein
MGARQNERVAGSDRARVEDRDDGFAGVDDFRVRLATRDQAERALGHRP